MSGPTSERCPPDAPVHTAPQAFVRSQDSAREQLVLEYAQRALLNILDDFAAEKSRLELGQGAMLNIFEDVEAERARMEGAQRAVLNILEDSLGEKAQLEATQRSVLNILDDFAGEKSHLQGTQRSVLNILDDFAGEKSHLEATQRSVLNILEDFDSEKVKVEQANQQLAKEVEERKRVEEEIQQVNKELVASNKELEAFSYSVSHDLRAPLRSIDGFTLAVLEDCVDQLDARGQDYLRRARAATQRMGALIDDLLNLSRVTRTEIRRERVDLTALAHTVAAELERTQPGRQVELAIAPGLEAQGDPRLLRVVLENLLGNAWKFTSSHERARIEFGAMAQDGTKAYFVRDDGAGFDPAYVGRLFGAFQRLHAMSEFPGTGIGLATVQRIIQRHEGRIWAEGAVEHGATFYFTLGPQ